MKMQHIVQNNFLQLKKQKNEKDTTIFRISYPYSGLQKN